MSVVPRLLHSASESFHKLGLAVTNEELPYSSFPHSSFFLIKVWPRVHRLAINFKNWAWSFKLSNCFFDRNILSHSANHLLPKQWVALPLLQFSKCLQVSSAFMSVTVLFTFASLRFTWYSGGTPYVMKKMTNGWPKNKWCYFLSTFSCFSDLYFFSLWIPPNYLTWSKISFTIVYNSGSLTFPSILDP